MALFRDDGWLKLGDLERYESGISEVLRLEGIGWEAKAAVALEQVERRLAEYLRREFRDLDGWTQVGHVRVNQGLRHWVAMAALAMVFEDAYSQQLNDRYRYKRDRYQGRVAEAEGEYFRGGIEYVWRPVTKAPRPEASEEAQTGSAGGRIYLAVTKVVEDREGGPSDPTAFDLEAGKTAVLRMPVEAAEPEVKWHVYAGADYSKMTRQTDEPLDWEASWVWSGELLRGPVLGDGQQRDVLIPNRGRIRRG